MRRCAALRAVATGLLLLTQPALSSAQAAPAAEVVVRGPARSPGERVLPAARAREAAGTQGDPVKALQGMPGLGRGGAGGGELVAWGSTPGESRVELDGVEIPQLYHGSGVRSVIQAGTVDTLAFLPGAFGAQHGRALGGLVLVRTRPADDTASHLRSSADFLDTSVLASSPMLGNQAAVQVAARYGYVARWLPRLIDPELRGLYRVPRYWDAQAEGNLRLGSDASLRLVLVTSSDASSSELLAADPARSKRELASQSFGRAYLVYRAEGRDGSHTQVTPFVGWDAEQQELAHGAKRSGLSRQALRYGLRASQRAVLSAELALTLGLDASGSASRVERQGSLAIPRREGDPYPFGTPPGSDAARDDFRTHVLGAALFAELELRAAGWQVIPALRFEPQLLEASRVRPPLGRLPDTGTSRLEALLEPRLSVERRLSSAARLFAAIGRYHQPPAASDLGARFGNPRLTSAAATHVSAGEAVSLRSGTRLELSVYAKWLSSLAVRSASPEPRLGESLVDSGRGRAFGAQLFVRQAERAGFSGWLSATLSRSERRDAAASSWRLSDYDSPLVLGGALRQRLGRFRLGARARFASGLPRTPVVGSYYDLGSQSYQPLLGATNSTRLQDFFQLDLRLDRAFTLGNGTSLEIYLDALNVTLRRNEEEWAYSSDFSGRGRISGLPPLAILGVTLER